MVQQETRRPKCRVLITGGGGRIGRAFALQGAPDLEIVLLDRPGTDWSGLEDHRREEVDVTDLDALKSACEGFDIVVHLAGDPGPSSTWASLHEVNIVGTYNTFVAAKAGGVRRVVLASSIHAVSGYPADVQVRTSDPVNPGDLYGVTKCFGEALGRYMAEQEGLSVIAIRIGAFQPAEAAADPARIGLLDAFVSEGDLCHLLDRAVRQEGVRFAIVHGLSENRFKRLDLTDTREVLGYRPEVDFVKENPFLSHAFGEAPLEHDLHSGEQESGLRDDL